MSFHPNRFVRLLDTSWPLFRAFRVDVRVSWTIVVWPILFALPLLKEMPTADAFAWGAAWTAALFTTTWTHEMGHIAMGRRCGIETDRITLRALGGLAHMGAPAQTPQDEMKIALAGPATHLLWVAVLFPATWMLRNANDGAYWFRMLEGFARVQIGMMVFNLLPIYPLDGGRTLRGALSLRMHANRASGIVAIAGFVGNGALILLGLLSWFEVADPLSFGNYGFLLVWIGIEGVMACRLLRFEAKHADIYGDHDPFQKALIASHAAVRGMEQDEEKERDERRAARERRRELQETTDRLLDRINELGGIDKLSARERKELERASRALSEET